MHVYVSYSHQGTQQAVVQQACVHGFNCARLHALSFCKRASLHPSGRCLSDCISHVHHYPPNQHMMHHIRCKVFISCKLLHSNHTCTHTYKHSHTGGAGGTALFASSGAFGSMDGSMDGQDPYLLLVMEAVLPPLRAACIMWEPRDPEVGVSRSRSSV